MTLNEPFVSGTALPRLAPRLVNASQFSVALFLAVLGADGEAERAGGQVHQRPDKFASTTCCVTLNSGWSRSYVGGRRRRDAARPEDVDRNASRRSSSRICAHDVADDAVSVDVAGDGGFLDGIQRIAEVLCVDLAL